MTAGVVVMNASAAAVAADSAVTIPHRDGVKHYSGATKLLALHGDAPVAAFWYGSPEYCGVPWELILRDFGSKQARPKRIADYDKALFDHLDKVVRSSGLADDDVPPEADLVLPLFAAVRKAMMARHTSSSIKLLHAAEVTAAERRRMKGDLHTTATTALARWRASLGRRANRLSDDQIDAESGLWEWFADQVAMLREDVGPLPDGLEEELRAEAREAWKSQAISEPGSTGVVLAGFGSAEDYPSLRLHLIGLPVGSHARRGTAKARSVSKASPALIAPFAFDQQMRLFMEGVHPGISEYLDGAIDELQTTDANKARLKDALRERVDENYRTVVDAVRFLPKADLAEFARQLVAFTALRLRVSMATEIVGEPVDVAVISLSEGVVWVHRTHYFPPELNPRYFARYR